MSELTKFDTRSLAIFTYFTIKDVFEGKRPGSFPQESRNELGRFINHFNVNNFIRESSSYGKDELKSIYTVCEKWLAILRIDPVNMHKELLQYLREESGQKKVFDIPVEDIDNINPIKRGEKLLGTPYGTGYDGEYNGSMIVPEKPIKVDCSEFIAYANDTSIYRTGEIGNNPDLEKVDEPQPGDIKVWRATNPKTGKTQGHAAIITGESGRRALLHSDDNPNGVRFTSDYLESYYKNRTDYTEVSIEYYRRRSNVF